MMSVETRTWLERVLGMGLGLAAGALRDEDQEGAAVLVERLAPTLIGQLLDELVDESVEVKVGPDATAGGVVEF